jgi:hypothetical protein
MKKYLITGVLALVVGGFLTSCHDTEGAYSSTVEQKLQAYEQVFKEEFGEIDPNQDWGFGETSMFPARTRASKAGEYANGNMWAAEGYSVPDPLTEGQKLRVQYYFQRVKNPGGTPDYGQRDFFMQQVYDGGTDPITKYDGYTSPAYSLEKYPAVSGQLIESGEHMDHLTAGPDHTHINNFNNGNCGVYGNVLDNGGDINNGPWHEDQIMLMKNTKTSCFGYANSDDSYRHDDRWTLVSGEVIDAYCDDPANGYADFLKAHPGVVDKKCYWDDWKRSYIGFDFDMLPDDKTYAWNWENGQKTTPKTVVYSGWASPQGGDNLIFTESGQVSTITDWNAEIKVKGNKVIRALDSNTNMYCGEVKGIGGMDGHREWTEVADYDPNGTNDNSLYIKGLPGYDSNHTALNMKFLAKKYEEGWLPVDTKQLKLWVKVGGCNDGYYSDWIVSFLPGTPTVEETTIDIEPGGGTTTGKRITTTTYMWELTEVQKGRIMCEDLGVIKASDIDFNDLVFDAYIYDAQKKKKVVTVDENNNIISGPTITDENESTRLAEIYILAAGGTLPISVAGERVKDHFGDGGISDAIIVNTCIKEGSEEGGSYSNPWQNYNTAQKIEKFENNITLKDIKVIVRYGDKILELYSQPGLAPHKICVPLDLASGVNVKWPLERVVIKEAYEDFTKYVKDEDETIVFTPDANSESGDPDSDGTNPNGVSYFNKEQSNTCWTRTEKINPDKLFNETVNYTPRNLNSDDGRYYIISTSTSEEDVDIQDTSKGYQQGETILVRRRH